MNALVPPSGIVTATDTVEMSGSQRAKLIARIQGHGVGARVVGLLLLIGCGLLTFLLIQDPLGVMPGFPNFWKGAPMILGASFCGVYGALLFFLRRFSLSAGLAAMVLAALFASGAQAYARTVREVETTDLDFFLPAQLTDAFIERSMKTVTAERLTCFLRDLHAEGILVEPPACDEISISAGLPPGGRKGQQISVRFVYCPFVHARMSPGRSLALQYVLVIAEGNHRALNATQWHGSLRGPLLGLCESIAGAGASRVADRSTAISWLVRREPDPELKEQLGAYAKIWSSRPTK